MKIIIIILCLLLSGCRIDYSLKITNDNKYVEKCDLLKYLPNGDSTYNSEDGGESFDIVESLRNQARGKLNTMAYSSYKITDIQSANYKGIRVARIFDGVASYNSNLLIKELYNNFSINLDKNIVTLSAKGLNKDSIEYKYDSIGMQVDNSTITIELPYKVLDNNADNIDKNKNIYTWYINKDTTEKDILLQYDVDSLYALNINTIGTKINMTVVYIILVILILVIVGYFVYKYIKKVYENKNKF